MSRLRIARRVADLDGAIVAALATAARIEAALR
jgi:hypothetical protein